MGVHIGAQSIGVGASNILGVGRIFARISPNMPKPFLGHFLCEYFLMKIQKRSSCDSAHVWRHFFKAHWGPFLPVFSGILLRFQRFSQILPRFQRILPRFSRILPGFSPNQNFWCALSPLHHRLLHHWPGADPASKFRGRFQ